MNPSGKASGNPPETRYDIRTLEADNGSYLHRDDLIAAIEATAAGFLHHIPGHMDAGEFLEAAQDGLTAQCYFRLAKSL